MTVTEMKIQVNTNYVDKTVYMGDKKLVAMMTPPIDKDYWYFKVKLFKDQFVVAFPKFGTMGIGFRLEDDWNTNLPFSCDEEKIANHIWYNRKYKEIKREDVIKAIKLIQNACKTLKLKTKVKRNEYTANTKRIFAKVKRK